jgi:cyanophycin synthetase
MNVFNEHPFKVLFDYGHNAHAVGMMADLARAARRARPAHRRARGPGDRRDEDLGGHRQRRRRPLRSLHLPPRRQPARPRSDEVPRIQARRCAPRASRSAISIIPDEQEAIDAALRMGRAGRPAADLRRCAGALLEADHQVQSEPPNPFPGDRRKPSHVPMPVVCSLR